MSIDTSLIVATAIGFISGLLISLQEIGLDYLINKVWMGWNITLKKIAFSVSSLSFLFGLGAFLLVNWQPAQVLGITPTGLVPFFLKTGILISIATPISRQIRIAASSKETAKDTTESK
ncbi:MAG: hypothetical protein AAF810_12125 [Cyanobacteria bacterium P01_D01_bin.36]